MHPRHLPLLLTALLFAACKTPAGKPLPLLTPFKTTAADSIYGSTRPPVQHFTINGGVAKTITAAAGTTILFPAQCFLNAAGETVSGPVQVDIVEALALKDFISGGLATVSDGKLLLSNGMLYLNATANGQQLQLDTANPITVTMPGMGAGGGFEMFTGDGSNWQPDSSMTAEPDYAFTLPLNMLYPIGNQSLWYCLSSYPDGSDRYYCLDTTVMNVTDKKYENTCIATLEFKNRYHWLLSMTYWISYMTRGIEPIKEGNCENNHFDLRLYKEYLDHPNRSLRVTDSVVKSIYINYYNSNKTKLAAFCDAVNKELRTYYSNWTDTNYHFDFRQHSLEEQYMYPVAGFPGKNTKEIKHFDTKGIDLNSADAFNLLLQKGVAVKEINEMLRYNFLRNQMIRHLQNTNENLKAKQKLENIYSTTVFSVTKMGWINCDRFYDDPAAGKAEIYVSNGSGTQLRFIDCSLVIPSMNVRLSAWQLADGRYSFTQKDGRYIKLPIGVQAVVVGTSLQGEKLYFAAQPITIKDGIAVNLPMQQIAAASLPDSLKAVLKN